MADRRSKNRNKNTDSQESPQPESQEEAVATATEESKNEEMVDLSGFENAVREAVAQSDDATGEVPTAALAAVTEQFRQLNGQKAKNRAKAFVNAQMKEAMASGNLGAARANLKISDNALTSAPSTRSEKAPADPTEAAVQRVATLQLAVRNVVLPEGVADNLDSKVEELVTSSEGELQNYLQWLSSDEETRGDEPQVSGVVRNAAKLAIGKSARAGATGGSAPYTGERRDVSKHIVHAFEGKEPGTFMLIGEIRNSKSPEYGDDLPSAGAISARLFPTDKDGNPKESTMLAHGIRPETRDGKKGAVLVG